MKNNSICGCLSKLSSFMKSNDIYGFLSKLISFFIIISAFCLLGVNIYKYYYEGVWSYHLGYSAIILLLIGMVDINSIYQLSIGSSITLKMKIKEADNVLTHLRKLITPVSELSMSLAARSGRSFHTPINRNRLSDLKKSIEIELRKIYPNDSSKIKEVFFEYHKFNKLDLRDIIFENIKKELREKFKKVDDNIQKLENTQKPIDPKNETFNKEIERHREIDEKISELKSIRGNLDYDDRNIRKDIENILTAFSGEEKRKILLNIESDIKNLEGYKE